MPETLNGFSVEVIANRVRPITRNGYKFIALSNRTYYKLKLSNFNSTRCDAKVVMDGEKIGTWRIAPFSDIYIERPANVNRRFFFVNENSQIATSAGVSHGNDSNGLIKVTFMPEEQTRNSWLSLKNPLISSRHYDSYPSTNSGNFSGQESLSFGAKSMTNQSFNNTMYTTDNSLMTGATVLGERSDQNYRSASAIKNVNNDEVTIISIRLVVDTEFVKPFISLREANIAKCNEEPPRPDAVPHERLYEDFFLLNKY